MKNTTIFFIAGLQRMYPRLLLNWSEATRYLGTRLFPGWENRGSHARNEGYTRTYTSGRMPTPAVSLTDEAGLSEKNLSISY